MGLKPLQSTSTSAVWKKKSLWRWMAVFITDNDSALGKIWWNQVIPITTETLKHHQESKQQQKSTSKWWNSQNQVIQFQTWFSECKRCDGVLTCCCHGTLLMQPGVLGYRTESCHLPSPPCLLLPWWCHGCSQMVMPASPSYLNPENLGRKTNFKR